MIRPIYDEEATILKWNIASTTAEGTSITATNFCFSGGSDFSLQLPISLSGHGGLEVQANNSNQVLRYVDPPITSAQAGYINKIPVMNPSFSANWVTISTIDNGVAFRSLNAVTCRYVRVKGAGLTANGMNIYFWSNLSSKGV